MSFKQWLQGELERIEAALTDRPEPDDWEVEGEEVARHKGRREALERAAVVYRSEQTRKGNEDNIKAVEAALGDVVRYCLEAKRDIQGGQSRDIVDYGMGKGAAHALDRVVEYIRRQPTGSRAVANATEADHFSPTSDPDEDMKVRLDDEQRAERDRALEGLRGMVENVDPDGERIRMHPDTLESLGEKLEDFEWSHPGDYDLAERIFGIEIKEGPNIPKGYFAIEPLAAPKSLRDRIMNPAMKFNIEPHWFDDGEGGRKYTGDSVVEGCNCDVIGGGTRGAHHARSCPLYDGSEESFAPPKSAKERARNRIERIEKLEAHAESMSDEFEELREMYRKQTRSVLDAAALLGEVVRAAREDADTMARADELFAVADRIKQYIETAELELGEGAGNVDL